VLPAEVMTPLYERWIASRPDPKAALETIARRISAGASLYRGAGDCGDDVFLLSPTQSGTPQGRTLWWTGAIRIWIVR